jgi:hypothetical protein
MSMRTPRAVLFGGCHDNASVARAEIIDQIVALNLGQLQHLVEQGLRSWHVNNSGLVLRHWRKAEAEEDRCHQ